MNLNNGDNQRKACFVTFIVDLNILLTLTIIEVHTLNLDICVSLHEFLSHQSNYTSCNFCYNKFASETHSYNSQRNIKIKKSRVKSPTKASADLHNSAGLFAGYDFCLILNPLQINTLNN